MNAAASSESTGRTGSGRAAPSRPVSPWTSTAALGSASSGRAAPAWTATSMPSNSRMTRALWVVRSSGALPATVVIPTRSHRWAATTMAMASSWPGSQSRITAGRSTAVAGFRHAVLRSYRGERSGRPTRHPSTRWPCRRRWTSPMPDGRRVARTRRWPTAACCPGRASPCTPRSSPPSASCCSAATTCRQAVDLGLRLIMAKPVGRRRRGVDTERVLRQVPASWPTPGPARRCARAVRRRSWRWRASRSCSTARRRS